ncbi:hypothetical protein BVC71_03220 [Marivivens niveibacter]|uniref:HTH gntR-type domain-containing protein n=1 Tax=Marivivens niveibacter TaxID=1930667 RepID=A0A251X2Y3_9RHOB|nr:GntR family transcriptional regulator [Marivivens niveibacter]OUD10523.1 hypothetical protein BVC71_03220 [Marivivens niveibacter]
MQDSTKLTRASRVSQDLKEAILRGDFEPGSKINLEEARHVFGVSLSPMREAMSRLVNEGLITFEDQRGYRIAPVSAANLAEITSLVASISTLAVSHAMTHNDLEWESNILAAFHRLRRSAEQDKNDWDRAYLAFLETLVQGCQMPTLIGFWRILTNQNDRYRRMARKAGLPPSASTIDACKAIADAAVSGNTDRTTALLRQQIEVAGERFRTALNGVIN